MLPDTIVADAKRTGQEQAGAFTGLWTAADTGGHAIAPLFYTVILTVTGYASSTLDNPATQTDTALNGILLGFSVVPALLLLVTIPLMMRYQKTDAAVLGSQHTSVPTPAH